MTDTATLDSPNQIDTTSNFPSAPVAPSEMDVLKSRAKMMGITFSNNIGIDALRTKVAAKMEGELDPEEDTDEQDDDAETQEVVGSTIVIPVAPRLSKRETEQQIRESLIKEQMRLIRIRITNMDPKKKDLPGEIITLANDFIGTVRKFIPFGEVTDNGYHVPYCLYMFLKERRFLNITTSRKNGQISVSSRWAQEFSIDVLEPLTQKELDQLAAAQAAAGGISDGME